MSLLNINGLRVSVGGRDALRGIDLSIESGETVGLVGESGSGKTMTALATMGLLPTGAEVQGAIRFDGRDLLQQDERAMQRFRGREAGIIFQEPMTALNPLLRIGDHVAEAILAHGGTTRAEAWKYACELLVRVGLPPDRADPGRYPHELSGGQRQRAMIAGAMALKPRLLIADEPTTALDVTTQARILDLLKRLVSEDGASLLLISHDLGVVAGMADRIAIMREGEIVERGPCPAMLRDLQHPYSRQLIRAAAPKPLDASAATRSSDETAALLAEDVACAYRLPGGREHVAVDGVSLSIAEGERVGLVGESGCGKSTLARALLGLEPPRRGAIRVHGEDLYSRGTRAQRRLRRQLQAVFQDPYGSFNPRHRIGRIVAEPLHLLGRGATPDFRRTAVAKALADVGLDPSDTYRYPHEFSGGQRQRIAIARALVLRPSVVVLDEPVSALDVSVRAQILALLAELNKGFRVGYLFISHDLTVVRAVAERVLVMRNGCIVEEGETRRVLDAPRHPYTQSLIDAAPDLTRTIAASDGPPVR